MKRVVVVQDHSGDLYYFDASTDELLGAAALRLLSECLESNDFVPPQRLFKTSDETLLAEVVQLENDVGLVANETVRGPLKRDSGTSATSFNRPDATSAGGSARRRR